MGNSLRKYLQAFGSLHTGSNPSHPWSNGDSPYKPFLLLSVIDLIEDGTIAENNVPLPDASHQLQEAFHQYWKAFFPGSKPDIKQPYVRLANDIPWYLHRPGEGKRLTLQEVKTLCQDGISKARLAKRVSYASFENDLFDLLREDGPRRELRKFIIRSYFTRDAWHKVSRHSRTNVASTSYAEWLIEKARSKTKKEPPTREVPIREAGFRKAVVGLYNRQCAFCRLRVRSPEDHTVVQAAHIIPWRNGRDDDPRNGLALCGVCHWTFDEGLLSVSNDLFILFSPYLERDEQRIGYLEGLKGMQIATPQESILWPREDALEWHRNVKFVDAM